MPAQKRGITLLQMCEINKITEEHAEDSKAKLFPCDCIENNSDIDNNKEFNIYGMGRWNENDKNFLLHFIHAHCRESESPTVRASLSLQPLVCEQKIDIELENLQPVSKVRVRGAASGSGERGGVA